MELNINLFNSNSDQHFLCLIFQKEDDDDDYFGDGPLGQKMPKPEPEPGEMIPDEAATGKKGKRKKKKKGVKAVSWFIIVSSLYNQILLYIPVIE